MSDRAYLDPAQNLYLNVTSMSLAALPASTLPDSSCCLTEGCRFLGDETFQKEIMICPIHGTLEEHMLWNVERMVDSHPPPKLFI